MPNALRIAAWRSPFTLSFHARTKGDMMQDVYPCGTSQSPPSTCPMAWLAPIGTPAMIGSMDCQTPIWHFSRASRSSGSAFARGSPSISSFRALSASPSQ